MRSRATAVGSITFPSRSLAAKYLGVTPETLLKWMREGRELAPRVNIRRLAQERGLKPSTVYTRIASGLSVERSLTRKKSR